MPIPISGKDRLRSTGKLQVLLALLREVRELNDRVVLVSNYTKVRALRNVTTWH